MNSHIIKNVMASAVESDIASALTNTLYVLLIRQALSDMGHPQPLTPICMNNITANNFLNETIKAK